MKKILLIILTLFCFSINVNALCYDEDLNNWAVQAEIQRIPFDLFLINEETGEYIGNTMQYVYIITTNPVRTDIQIKAKTSNGETINGKYIPGHKVHGIGGYTTINGVKYDIEIYGSKDSACPGELLKTLKYEMEPYNYYYKTQYCEDYPDAPNCDMYKDTSNLSEEEFKESMEQYINEVDPPKNVLKIIFDFMINYGIFVLIPALVIYCIYFIKIRKVKNKERNK